MRGSDEAGEFHGRHSREVLHRRGIGGRGCQAYQPGDLALPGSDDRRDGGGDGGEGARDVRVFGYDDGNWGVE